MTLNQQLLDGARRGIGTQEEGRIGLGVAYIHAGRAAAAIPLLEPALKLQEARLGPDHPHTLSARNNLAAAYEDAGRTAEAIALYEATLEVIGSKLGPDHPNTLTVRTNLAAAYLLLTIPSGRAFSFLEHRLAVRR